MDEQNPALPPLPHIQDETGEIKFEVASVFLDPGVGVELTIQAQDDGSYRTSEFTIGRSMSRITIFGGRDQIERLHRLLGQHLEQLDAYETTLYAQRLERDGIAADVPDDVKRAAMDTRRNLPGGES